MNSPKYIQNPAKETARDLLQFLYAQTAILANKYGFHYGSNSFLMM